MLRFVFVLTIILGCAAPRHVRDPRSYDTAALNAMIDGLMLEMSGDYLGAIDHYSDAVHRDSASPTLLTTLARGYFAIGDLDKSYTLAQAALARDGNDLSAMECLADVQIQWRRYELAAETLRQILERDPSFTDARYRLITLLEYQGRSIEAAEQYEALLAIIGPHTPLALKLSEIYIKAKLYAKAVAALKKSGAAESQDIQLLDALGQAHALNGDMRNAFDVYQKIAILNPGQPLVQVRLGSLALQIGEFRKSIEYFKEAEKSFPNSMEIKRSIGFAYSQMKADSEAIVYLESAVAGNGKDIFSWSLLANLYQNAGNFVKSDYAYDRCLALDPSNDLILNNYSYSLATRSLHLDRALRMIELALKKAPRNSHYLDTIGWIYFQMKQYDRALKYVKDSWEINSTSWEVADHLGDIYAQLRKHDTARLFWQKALDLNPSRTEILEKMK